MDKLNNQARFVQMIVDKELVVANRKKADIVVELRKLKFRPFPVTKTNENEDNIDEEQEQEQEQEGSDSDYDYLLGMAIWSLTKEKVQSDSGAS